MNSVSAFQLVDRPTSNSILRFIKMTGFNCNNYKFDETASYSTLISFPIAVLNVDEVFSESSESSDDLSSDESEKSSDEEDESSESESENEALPQADEDSVRHLRIESFIYEIVCLSGMYFGCCRSSFTLKLGFHGLFSTGSLYDYQ